MKLSGALILCLGFAVLGLQERLRLQRRARLVSDMAAALELLRAEIVTRLAPLPEAAERLGRYGPEGVRTFFLALALGLEEQGGSSFAELWTRGLGLLELTEPSRRALEELGASLGRYTAEEQASAISVCESRLRREAERAGEEARVTGRLRAGLALGGGLILAIVLY